VLVALAVAVLPARGQSLDRQAGTLRSAVAAEEARIARTSAGLGEARGRLAAIEADLRARQDDLARTDAALVRARARIERLTNRSMQAERALERNLVAAYERPAPDLVSVVVGARGFSALLDDLEFRRRIAEQDARILDNAREQRTEVLREARGLVELMERDRRLAAEVERRRAAAEVIALALERRREAQVARREQRAARLRDVEDDLRALRARQRRAAAAAERAAGPRPADVTLDRGGMAQAPAGAPEAVRAVIAAGNVIAGLPYQYGGGHASFRAAAYDCSGSISYALAAAGLVRSPLASTGFMSWGEAGPGRWITVYANAGHAFMVVGGWRFDTSALRSGGTRWTREMRSTAGFVARHPPGL
jgi:hypothetical protein